MSIYFIDYENVRESGINGIGALTESDIVYVFYSENANMMSFDMHKQLSEAKAVVKYTKVEAGTKNSLDFQLVTFLGYITAKNEKADLFIVSKDKGFESVCKFWKSNGRKIKLVFDLNGENADEVKAALTAGMRNIGANDEDIKSVIEFLNTLKTKQGINNAFVKKFGNKKAGEFYKAVKPFIKDKK